MTGGPPVAGPMQEIAAAAALRAGAVVAYPTETFYALGADPRSPAGVAEVFRLKGRPPDRRLPWIAASREQVEAVCRLPPTAAAFVDRCWPGPVTLVLPLRGGSGDAAAETVAVRVSPHPLARALAAALGHPVVSTSANPSGEPPVTTAAAVRSALAGRAGGDFLVLDGGPTPGGEPSAIVDLTGPAPRVLRGSVPGLLLP